MAAPTTPAPLPPLLLPLLLPLSYVLFRDTEAGPIERVDSGVPVLATEVLSAVLLTRAAALAVVVLAVLAAVAGNVPARQIAAPLGAPVLPGSS